jgi:hypothetical protein
VKKQKRTFYFSSQIASQPFFHDLPRALHASQMLKLSGFFSFPDKGD